MTVDEIKTILIEIGLDERYDCCFWGFSILRGYDFTLKFESRMLIETNVGISYFDPGRYPEDKKQLFKILDFYLKGNTVYESVKKRAERKEKLASIL